MRWQNRAGEAPLYRRKGEGRERQRCGRDPTSCTMLQLATAGVYNPNPTDAVRERRASGQGGADGRGRTPGAA